MSRRYWSDIQIGGVIQTTPAEELEDFLFTNCDRLVFNSGEIVEAQGHLHGNTFDDLFKLCQRSQLHCLVISEGEDGMSCWADYWIPGMPEQVSIQVTSEDNEPFLTYDQIEQLYLDGVKTIPKLLAQMPRLPKIPFLEIQ